MKTNDGVKTEVILITPKIAESWLGKNQNNRKYDRGHAVFLADEIEKGNWCFNGNSIVFDKEGTLKDGQHRLQAILIADKPIESLVVSGVDVNVMQTIDTGKSRNLGDILSMNSIKNATSIAAATVKIINYDNGSTSVKPKQCNSSMLTNRKVSNTSGLEYVKNNEILLQSLFSEASRIYSNGAIKVLSKSDICLFLYVISGGDFNEEHLKFMLEITGSEIRPKSITNWLYKKLVDGVVNHRSIKGRRKLVYIIKAWNCVVEGSSSTYLTYDPKIKAPKPLKI